MSLSVCLSVCLCVRSQNSVMGGPINTKLHRLIYLEDLSAQEFFYNFRSKVKGQGRQKVKITFRVITPERNVVETSEWYQNFAGDQDEQLSYLTL